jgi:tetratricopeptide (TPR) repeat protein
MKALRLALATMLFAAPAAAEESHARELYEEALKQYNLGDYDRAIEGFKQAYLATEAPELLFNIAQAYRLKGPGNCGSALQFYRTYLRLDPKTGKRKSIEGTIAEMERCAAHETPAPADEPPAPAAAPAPAPSPAPATPRSTESGGPPLLPILVGGAGALMGLGGGVLLVWSKVDYDHLKNSGCAPHCDRNDVDPPRTRQVVGYVLTGVGAALATTGVVLWFTAPRADHRAWLRPTVGGLESGLVF